MPRGGGSRPGPSDAGAGAEADGTGGLAAEAPGVAAVTRPVSAATAATPPSVRAADLRAQCRDAGRRTRIPASGPPWSPVTAVRPPPSGIQPLNSAPAGRARRRARLRAGCGTGHCPAQPAPGGRRFPGTAGTGPDRSRPELSPAVTGTVAAVPAATPNNSSSRRTVRATQRSQQYADADLLLVQGPHLPSGNPRRALAQR